MAESEWFSGVRNSFGEITCISNRNDFCYIALFSCDGCRRCVRIVFRRPCFHLDLLHFQRNVSNVSIYWKQCVVGTSSNSHPLSLSVACSLCIYARKRPNIMQFVISVGKKHTLENWNGAWCWENDENEIEKTEIFSITTYAVAQKDMNDIFQVHWKHTYEKKTSTTVEERERGIQKKKQERDASTSRTCKRTHHTTAHTTIVAITTAATKLRWR